ncbi:MAG: hypothetical protein MJ072_03125, partial [Clostridia bacterium]|nr:hypothetical protein [Clostridia bacterium]
ISLAVIMCLSMTLFGCSAQDEEALASVEAEFLEDAPTEIMLGDGLVLAEVIKYVKNVENVTYELTLTDADGKKTDITTKRYISAEVPGEYKITYTLKAGQLSKSNTFTYKVICQPLVFSYTRLNAIYNVGDVLVFDNYFDKLNISTNSYYDWKVVMDSVEIDGAKTNIAKGATSFTFQIAKPHKFNFHLETEDGQTKTGYDQFEVTNVDKDFAQYLTEIGATLYGVEEGKMTGLLLQNGVYANGIQTRSLSKAATPHNLPYVAFDGEFGLGSFVKVDFTGKNIPAISFFRKNYTKSVFDESDGIIVSAGFNKNTGAPANEAVSKQISVYGPNMINDITSTVLSLGDGETAYAGSYASLNDNTKYRLIVGFTQGETENTLMLNLIIVDLDNKVVVNQVSASTKEITKQDFTLDGNYLKGTIVLYGNYAKKTTIDKLYSIITDKTFAELCSSVFDI